MDFMGHCMMLMIGPSLSYQRVHRAYATSTVRQCQWWQFYCSTVNVAVLSPAPLCTSLSWISILATTLAVLYNQETMCIIRKPCVLLFTLSVSHSVLESNVKRVISHVSSSQYNIDQQPSWTYLPLYCHDCLVMLGIYMYAFDLATRL